MQIKIEIDVKPEELRRFLGLPDVAGLQEDVVHFLREKVGQVNDNFNPADFVKGNFEQLKKSPAWKKLMARIIADDVESENSAPPTKPRRRPRASKKSSSTGKSGT